MSVFLTSDLHLGHANAAAKFRPFDGDVDAMNAHLLGSYNDTVQDGDTVFILGDIAMGTLVDSLALVAQMKGDKFLIPGNHDRVSPAYGHSGDVAAKVAKFAAMYADAGLTILPDGPFLFHGHTVMMSHFPYDGDHGSHADDPRYMDLRPADVGLPLFHGHMHSKPADAVRGHMLDVGVDAHGFRPIAVDAALRLLGAAA